MPSDAVASAEDWKNTILAGLANYIDGGSIVAGSAALALWVSAYHLSPAFVGLIGAKPYRSSVAPPVTRAVPSGDRPEATRHVTG